MANRICIAGCDIGKSSASFVTGEIGSDGALVLNEAETIAHDGKPFEVFETWYRDNEIHTCAALGATGLYAAELIEPAIVLPEDSCQEAALGEFPDLPGTLNLVSVGARGYGVLARAREIGEDDRIHYIENDKCSSGTGENIRKIASRFGLTVEEADKLALGAEKSIAITARCSVFAKTEMTHYANQGKPSSDLFRGYFRSVARNTHALLTRNRVSGPVYLIGGCAQIESFRTAIEELVGEDVHVPPNHLAFEAIGAAIIAAEEQRKATFAPLPEDPRPLMRDRGKRLNVLEPAYTWKDKTTLMPAVAGPEDWADQPAVLGLDLGSTGAKAVLTSIATGVQLLDVYDRTRGNPVDASRRLLRAILDRGTPDVRAIGLTGSGREAVATLLRAVYGDTERLVVLNEIVAHATGAIRCDPDAGRDLSIIEIGGQDAKYARVSGGRIIESDMNKACSAGTGSFLEEQAQFYDVHDIAEFVELARDAKRPPDLGQMCTVYVADAGAEALKEGFELADIFAGFQYSVIHNYLDRVMGQRNLGEKVFFQGKPASNPSLAWTLAAVTGRHITVPPNPGAMGAWGIGLCAIDELAAADLASAAPFDLEQILSAEITDRSEFQCRDKKCQTLCPIERTTISVDGDERVAISGGACAKYEIASQILPKLEKTAPNPFEERAKLLTAFERSLPDRPVVSIPMTGPIAGYLPWLATFVSELGFSVKVLQSDSGSLARGEELCSSFDSCGPTKIAHAICDQTGSLLFFPKILDIADPTGPGGQTCVTEQAMPEIVEQSLRTRGRDVQVFRPRLSFRAGELGAKQTFKLRLMAKAMGANPLTVSSAIAAATLAQRDFERRLLELGREALDYARANTLPSVVVCGPLHVIHERSMNATIPSLLRQNGAMAIPMDCFPVDGTTPLMEKVYWGEHNRFLRVAATARKTSDVFPLMLSSFGCGPASFTEQILQSILEGYPHTILETDGHGGVAGYVTRIQAFLQSVHQFLGEGDQAHVSDNEKALSFVGRGKRTGAYLDRNVHYVFLSSLDYFGELFAAMYRAYGYDAVAAPPLSEENFSRGRRDCSGKECLSYQMVWGAFREYLEENPPPPDRETRLVQISGESCRAGVFGVKDRITLDKLGYEGVTVTSLKIAGGPAMTAKLWAGLAARDVIRQLYLYHLAVDLEGAEALYHLYSERILKMLEVPNADGWSIVPQLRKDWRQLKELIDEASIAFADLEKEDLDPDQYRTVFVSGDLMTKGNDVANGGVYKHLGAKKVRVVCEPACDFIEFLARAQPQLIYGRGSSRMNREIYNANMGVIRRGLYNAARVYHPWLPMPDVKATLRKTTEMLDNATNGGAAHAIGSVLYHWEQGHYDGVVMTACWGCDNGLVSESLLRNRRDIPIYFFYDDATPLDERKLASFVFRLHRRTRNAPEQADNGRDRWPRNVFRRVVRKHHLEQGDFPR